jgi:hypothetical protein
MTRVAQNHFTLKLPPLHQMLIPLPRLLNVWFTLTFIFLFYILNLDEIRCLESREWSNTPVEYVFDSQDQGISI